MNNLLQNSILQGNNDKVIKTMNLNITGNIITWQDCLVQISNVSYITAKGIQQVQFPWITIPALVIGIMLFRLSFLVALIIVICSLAGIVLWYKEYDERNKSIALVLAMNSGDKLVLIFNDRSFLAKVMDVLKKIITDGGIGKNNSISIDLSGCQFKGDATLLNNLGIKQ